ncbi:hypothetical protein QP580_13115, partial [Prevotella bivia]|nr:hypothetical protein [Prevotella bivia]
VSDHPLHGLEHVLAQNSSHTISQLAEVENTEALGIVNLSGLVTGIQRKTTKKGDTWAIVTMEDLEGSIDCLLFPNTY